MPTTKLKENEKAFVDEIIFELGLKSKQEMEVAYRQGFRKGMKRRQQRRSKIPQHNSYRC